MLLREIEDGDVYSDVGIGVVTYCAEDMYRVPELPREERRSTRHSE
jgi:hypothetical protein